MASDEKRPGEVLARSLRGRMDMARRNRQARAGADATTADAESIAAGGVNSGEVNGGEVHSEEVHSGEVTAVESTVEASEITPVAEAEEIPVLYCAACTAEALVAETLTAEALAAEEIASADLSSEDPTSDDADSLQTIAEYTCIICKDPLCEEHRYHEEGGTLNYCRDCADEKVGICADCGILHARPCRDCGKKICDDCAKKVIERWGWGGAPGQGGVTSWFPFIRTYCQDHGHGRIDLPAPNTKSFAGFDGSSPEW